MTTPSKPQPEQDAPLPPNVRRWMRMFILIKIGLLLVLAAAVWRIVR